MKSSFKPFVVVVAALLTVTILTLVLLYVWVRPEIVEEDVRQIVVTTIQREAEASFFITGSLDLTASVTVENTKYLLPDLFRFNLGTTRATVRVPGRISYGFDTSHFQLSSVRIAEDGVIEVAFPDLQVYSVEPDLERMEVQTEVGWARLQSSSGREVEQRAIRLIRDALREQSEVHLSRSVQPRVNTARAIQKLLTPILQVAGMEDPRFRIQIGPEIVMESD